MNTATEVLTQIDRNKSAKFVSFLYTSKENGEVARHTLILNADTENLYLKDIDALTELMKELKDPVALQAAQELLLSRLESINKGIGNNSAYVHSADKADTYEMTSIKGVKIHKESLEFHIIGLTVSKTVITEGTPRKVVKSSAKTIEKNKIRRQLPSGRFREFVLTNIKTVKINGETLEIE